MNSNADEKRLYDSMNTEEDRLKAEAKIPPIYCPTKHLETDHPDFLRAKLGYLAKQVVFRYKPEYTIQLDTRKMLIRSLLLLLLEYLFHFAFQLIGYFSMAEFWRRSKYHPGWKTATELPAEAQALETFFKAENLLVEDYDPAPTLQAPATAWCPCCHASFVKADLLCQDCGGVELKQATDIPSR